MGPERKAVMLPDATVTAVGLRVVKLLVGNPPQSIDELALATGVTRTAVIEQLRMLVKAGLAERHTQRLGSRGRPRYLFSATTAALLMLFASNQNMVVPAIWEAIGTLGGVELPREGPPPRQPDPGGALCGQDFRHDSPGTFATIHRTASRRRRIAGTPQP